MNDHISLIAAISVRTRALGKDGDLLWQIREDMKRFVEITTGHPVVMGRKTWESIPEKYRPLSKRTNIVVTRQSDYAAGGAEVATSLEVALAIARTSEGSSEIFIIGGGELYKESLPLATKLYMTLIDDEKDADVFFPEYENLFTKKTFDESHESNGIKYEWVDLERE